jgi:hypothetical protein
MQMKLSGQRNIVQYVDSSFEPPMRGGMVEAYLLTEFCPGIGPLWCQVAAAFMRISQKLVRFDVTM